jgi:hypothetical protein
LHKSEGERERKPQLRVGQPPARRLLDAADAIGDGVAVDAEGVGRLGETGQVEHGPERGETLTTDVRPTAQERGEEGACLARSVRQVVQVAQ